MRLSASLLKPAVVLAFSLFLSAGRSAEAVPIFKGDGAYAWADTLNQFSQQTGSTPAFVSGTATVHYSYFATLAPGSVPVAAMAYASSTPSSSAAHLLELRGYGSSPNPGQTVGATDVGTSVMQNASWSNVEATVQSPNGAPLPGSIRLNFELAYTSPDAILTDIAELNSPFKHIQSINLNGNFFYLPREGQLLENDGDVARMGSDGLLHGNLHLDLPLSATGVSSQFSVSLDSEFPAMASQLALNNANEMTLTLKGITLPDGEGLESAGYSISFESGLPAPPVQPVPEPSTWLAWGVLAAGGVGLNRRRRAGARPHPY